MSDPIDFAKLMRPVAVHLLGQPNKRLSNKTTLRFGTNGSLAVEIAGDKAGTFYDYEHRIGGGLLEFIRYKTGAVNGAGVEWLRKEGFLPKEDTKAASKPPPRIAATYEYQNPDGSFAYQVVRYEPKGFKQRRRDVDGNWVWNLNGVERVPYRLPELLKSAAHETVFIPEGEKDVDALRAHGLVATCNPQGAGKWLEGMSRYLRDRDVVLLPDSDEAGVDHALDVARKLRGTARSIRIVRLPGLRHKGDASDYLAAGGTVEALLQIAAKAPEWADEEQPEAHDPSAAETPPEEPEPTEAPPNLGDLRAEAERLSRLSALAYGLDRKAVAKRFGFTIPTLEKEVQRVRQRRRAEAAQADRAQPAPERGEVRWPHGFTMEADGLYADTGADDGPTWICGPLEVLGEVRDRDDGDWGILLAWKDRDGRPHQWVAPRRLLVLTTPELETSLLDQGLSLEVKPSVRGRLREGLNGVQCGSRVRSVERPGWHGPCYVMPDAEVIGIVDSDYQVDPGWLRRCAPAFADPWIGFVQTPQDYRDWQQARYYRRLYYSYKYFFAVSQPSRNEHDGAIFAGTMGLIRRVALDELGGWDEWCITEDAELSLRLLRAGWHGLHVDETFGHGIMPLTFEALKGQRYRWCFGGIQILRLHWRSMIPGRQNRANHLDAGQRWSYLAGALQWYGDLLGLLFLIFLLAGAFNLATGGGQLFRKLTIFLVAAVPVMVLLGLVRAVALLRRGTGATWRDALGAFFIWQSTSLVVARASVPASVSYTHLRAHETPEHFVCRLLLEKNKTNVRHYSNTLHIDNDNLLS